MPSDRTGYGLEAMLRRMGEASGRRVLRLLDTKLVKERPDGRRLTRYRVLLQRDGADAAEHTWYGKEYFGAKGARVGRRLRYLRGALSLDVAVPEPIGYSKRERLLVTASIEGRFLFDLLGSEEDRGVEEHLERLGRGLADVHTLVPSWGGHDPQLEWPRHGNDEEARVLEEAMERVAGSSLPVSLARSIHWSGSRVRQDLQRGVGGSFIPSLLHGDLHPGQVIVGPQRVGLIDWDEAALGEPELDVGNMAAHLVLHDLQRFGAVRQASLRIRILTAAYQSRRPFRPERVAVHTSSALLRLASLERLAVPQRSAMVWPDLAAALLDAAHEQVNLQR